VDKLNFMVKKQNKSAKLALIYALISYVFFTTIIINIGGAGNPFREIFFVFYFAILCFPFMTFSVIEGVNGFGCEKRILVIISALGIVLTAILFAWALFFFLGYASYLRSIGVPSDIIAERLGDTVQVIESTYAHLYRDREESLFLIALESKRQAIRDYCTKKDFLESLASSKNPSFS